MHVEDIYEIHVILMFLEKFVSINSKTLVMYLKPIQRMSVIQIWRFRFDGYFSQMVAALGCVQKYDSPIENEYIQDENGETVSLSGVAVATLRGRGNYSL